MSYGFQPPPYQPNAPPPMMSYPPNAPPAYQPGPRSAVIRHFESGLCLDATNYDVIIQHYNNSPAQQWMLEPVTGNTYIIRNKANGFVLDIEGGPDCGAHLITYEGHGGTNQQWYINQDRTISSAAADVAIDVNEGNIYPGNILIAYDRHGGPNQQFMVEYI